MVEGEIMARQALVLTVTEILTVVVAQSLSHVQLFATPWTEAHQVPLSSTISWSLFKFMSIESMILFNRLILYYPFSSCL